MTRARLLLISGVLPSLLLIGVLGASQRAPRGFPHDKHQKLFPLCEGCHAGIATGLRESTYPKPTDCARCHDGKRAVRVEWTARVERPSNMHFSHSEHGIVVGRSGDSVMCQSCHAASGPARRMNVAGPDPARCLPCHAHASETHLAPKAKCSSCHVPLVRATSLPAERIARFPRPPWHDTTDFLLTHGRGETARGASCAVCHARETCERCHANASQVPMIAALGRDSRVAKLEDGKRAEYPEPSSHNAGEWSREHGAGALGGTAGIASCANCHTRSSCQSCHLESESSSGNAINRLPRASGDRGVRVADAAARVHDADIATHHGKLAATGALECAQCHSARTCSACHAGQDSRAFHAANFVERHAVDVFASTSDCVSCHNTERFCRDCHTRTGVASQSMTAAFHTGQPLWVLSHGQAARTGMESCASCHRQNDCVRCHSATGGWGIKPHGPGFPANALASRNATSCQWCHVTLPGGGR